MNLCPKTQFGALKVNLEFGKLFVNCVLFFIRTISDIQLGNKIYILLYSLAVFATMSKIPVCPKCIFMHPMDFMVAILLPEIFKVKKGLFSHFWPFFGVYVKIYDPTLVNQTIIL